MENTCARVSLLIKLQAVGIRPSTLLKTLAHVFSSFVKEINNFPSKDLDSRFKLVKPQLVLTVKWKFGYIICRKVKKEKNE